MAQAHPLQLTPGQSGATLSPQQKRFNSLIRRIGESRALLAAWTEAIDAYRRERAQVLHPLFIERDAARRRWAFALDALLAQPDWTRLERETLSSLVCEAAGGLLDAGIDDAELKALFDRHSDISFDEAQEETARAMKEVAELMTGMDLGDAEDIHSREDLLERVRQSFAQQAAEEEAQDDPARDPAAAHAARPGPRPSAAQLKREAQAEAEAQQATQSVREVYRKLASALHPDREPDVAQREAKTALMQRANQAYKAGDLLTLLELQLQSEQIDPDHAARADPKRLKHYNKVLAEQFEDLRREIAHVEALFGMEFGLRPGLVTQPRQVSALVERQRRELQSDLAAAAADLWALQDRAAVKRLLRAERRRLREQDAPDFGFF